MRCYCGKHEAGKVKFETFRNLKGQQEPLNICTAKMTHFHEMLAEFISKTTKKQDHSCELTVN